MGLKIKRLIVCLFGLFIGSCPLVRADGAGTTGGAVLKQTIDARGAGMGNSGVAGVRDINSALFYNPAGLSSILNQEVSSLYIKGLADIYYGFLGFCCPVGNAVTFGIGITTLQAGDIIINSLDGTTITKKAEQDYLFTLAFSTELPFEKIQSGINIKILSSNLLEEYNSTNFAFDIGFLKQNIFDHFSLGLSFQNIGTSIKYIDYFDPLPFLIRTGVTYQLILEKNNHILFFNIDGTYSIEKKFNFFGGVECQFYEMLAFRFGYRNDLSSVTAGFGFNWDRLQFNYSIGSLLGFSSSHLVSLSYKFGDAVSSPVKSVPDQKNEIKTELPKKELDAINISLQSLRREIILMKERTNDLNSKNKRELLSSVSEKLEEINSSVRIIRNNAEEQQGINIKEFNKITEIIQQIKAIGLQEINSIKVHIEQLNKKIEELEVQIEETKSELNKKKK